MRSTTLTTAVAATLVAATSGLAAASPASAAECYRFTGQTSQFVYVDDWWDTCGIVGAKHQYSPIGSSVVAWTSWYYDDHYARTPSLPTVIAWRYS